LARIIESGKDEADLLEARKAFLRSRHAVALTGAGISVESGIPDFRSPGGLWSVFQPDEYATLDVFIRDPAKAWDLYRALGRTLEGKQPNPAHLTLARFERAGRLARVVTQNVDGLHQAAGCENVLEVHGDHQHLQCIKCGWIGPMIAELLYGDEVPACPNCTFPLKPNVVLFGEDVRGMDRAMDSMRQCDFLLVIGTSAQVYPAAGLPTLVQSSGGIICEFNLEETALTSGLSGGLLTLFDGGAATRSDFLFKGSAGEMLTLFAEEAAY